MIDDQGAREEQIQILKFRNLAPEAIQHLGFTLHVLFSDFMLHVTCLIIA